MRVLKLLSALVLLSAPACTTYAYRVSPEAVDPPSFVVAPHDGSSMQREYAARVESALLAFGFDVYTMPPIREVVTRKKAIERSSGEVRSESPGESVNESGATQLDVERVEHYLERQGIQANHVVESLAHAYDIGAAAQFTQAWVRVYELKSKRLVASFSVVPYKEPRFIYDAFSAAGFPVERVEAD